MSDPDLTVSAVLADDLREWLTAELRYPVLAINTADGPPNQSVMWFDLHPDRPDIIVMNTMVRRLKYRPAGGFGYVPCVSPQVRTWILPSNRSVDCSTNGFLARSVRDLPQLFQHKLMIDVQQLDPNVRIVSRVDPTEFAIDLGFCAVHTGAA